MRDRHRGPPRPSPSGASQVHRHEKEPEELLRAISKHSGTASAALMRAKIQVVFDLPEDHPDRPTLWRLINEAAEFVERIEGVADRSSLLVDEPCELKSGELDRCFRAGQSLIAHLRDAWVSLDTAFHRGLDHKFFRREEAEAIVDSLKLLEPLAFPSTRPVPFRPAMPAEERPTPDPGGGGFWGPIEASRTGRMGFLDSILDRLAGTLSQLPVESIAAWDRTLRRLLREAASAPGLSDIAEEVTGRPPGEGLDDFICWLVIRGEARFAAAVSDPHSLTGITDRSLQCASLLSVAEQAYERKTGRDDYEEIIDGAFGGPSPPGEPDGGLEA